MPLDTDFTAFLQHTARQVRREIVEYIGFVEPQASLLPGMCGEAVARTIEHLRKVGHQARGAFLHLRAADGAYMNHFVAVVHGLLVDPTVTQLTASACTPFRLPDVPADGFVFSQPDLEKVLPGYQSAFGPMYPVGRITAAEWREIQPESNYAGRAYMLFSYPTRFASHPEELQTITPFLRAYGTDDIEWRRTCAAGLEMFKESQDPQVIRLAKALREEADDLVHQIALRHLPEGHLSQ